MHDFTYRPVTLDNYFDKIFYINLRKDTVRNEKMLSQFNRFNVNNFERIDAIVLTELPVQNEYRNFNKQEAKYILGSISCRASHLQCIKIAKDRLYSKVLILEDDAVFLQDPNLLLTQNQDILNDWDLLYFGGLIEPFFRNQIVCAHAYGVRNVLFDDTLNMAIPSGMEIDNFYAKMLQHMSYNHNQSGKYNIRVILPFNQVVQDQSLRSNIR